MSTISRSGSPSRSAADEGESSTSPAIQQNPVFAETFPDPGHGHNLASVAETNSNNLQDTTAGKIPTGKTVHPSSALAATAPGDDRSASMAVRPRSEPFPVENWDKYEFQRILGRGGMGDVFQARDRRLNRIVALKFIRGDDPILIQRFLQEARAQACLDHPNLCRIYDVGQVDGKPYIAMQFVDGHSLDRIYGELNLHQKVELIRDAAIALHEAHRIGIIHRDIKPANILVQKQPDGRYQPIVMDFGLARESSVSRGLTETGTVMGTPGYMPPEQARGNSRHLDRRADIYSLGATLYELLTGQPPFTGQEVVEVILAVLSDDPKPLRTLSPDISVDLETIVLKCLVKEPVHRYDSARALADDLQRFIDGEPIQGRRSSLSYRLLRRIRRNRALFMLGLIAAIGIVLLAGLGLRIKLQSRRQVALAQMLGQEIKDMEWILRSARQLPLHDLEREKDIIRKHMKVLEADLSSYGEMGRGLAYYALGRGHLALHEYAQARTQLELALQHGNQSAEVQYTLGLVLGKHHEQAMAEALMGGGGDWAKKQLQTSEREYMTPALAALKRSRELKLDAPEYLEGLMAYYQSDYAAALKHAAAALLAAPWLYEAAKLAGDVHRTLAVHARDSGHDDEAAREFAAAVRSYEEAAESGRSDAEVYAGLADAWVYQIELLSRRNQSIDEAIAAALAAGTKLTTAEPGSTAGALRKAHAAATALDFKDPVVPPELFSACMTNAAFVLRLDPGNPYASERAAFCLHHAAAAARARGEDPEPILRQAIGLLEPAVQKHPQFLWGNSDLAGVYCELANQLQLHGNPDSKAIFLRALEYIGKAVALDPNYLRAYSWALEIRASMVWTARSDAELQEILTKADDDLEKSKSINPQDPYSYGSYFLAYARATWRTYLAGQDPQARLARALASLAQSRKLGGPFLDVEQQAMLVYFVAASASVQAGHDPGPALADADATLGRCLKLGPQDVTCQTLMAKIEWVHGDWLAAQDKPALGALQRAEQKAITATQSPEKHPDSWQALAETELRLARVDSRPAERDRHLLAGLKATENIFAINTNHALGRATQGALLLARAQGQRDCNAQRSTAEAAVRALTAALQSDPLLTHYYSPLLAPAKALTTVP